MKIRALILLSLLLSSGSAATAAELPATWQEDLFAAREAAWRGFFGDPDALSAILTEDFVAIDRGAFPFSTKAQVLEQSRQVTAAGVRLASLAFPDNVVQRYGEVAIIYTTYSYATQKAGGPADKETRGRATELFRWDGRHWLHTGWHLGPAAEAPAP